MALDFVIQVSLLAGSLILLVLSSHFTIRSLEELIELTGLSEASVGFVILAVLTSIPEITVAFFSVLQGTPGISIGDVLGSNVFNIAVVIGILAMLGFLKTCCNDLLVELTDILFLTSLIPLLMIISHYHIFNVANPIVGVILLVAFVITIFFMARKRTPAVDIDSKRNLRRISPRKVLTKMIISFLGVLLAARIVVYSATNITSLLGIAPILIGAKIVAIGTSLPELTIDFMAVRKGRIQLAMGDIIGSNLTNLTLILGSVLITSSSAVDMTIFSEIIPFLLVTTIVFWRFLTKGGVSKVGGVILIFIYILFEAVLF